MNATQQDLFSLLTAQYGCGVNDPPTTWADYIRDAVAREGMNIARLARLANIHRSTIFRWKDGRDADNITVASIRAVADAIGDDPANALRAAGRLPDQPDPPQPTADREIKPLADEIARIRALGDHLGLPPEQTLRAISQLIDAYERLPAADRPTSERRRPA